ncbi:hypothetical protein [Asticcacaulis sp. MM231]|uniref:hypothetical protein n=1 Tax=Asticcacaulis sp. MM231 TaxID=3157666 RepID=UPI0032D58639
MDTSHDIAADLTPLEQRRERLRAFAERVLEAVEALPMPKNAVDSERTLRTITAADRMLVQIYSKVSAAATVLPQVTSPVVYTPSKPVRDAISAFEARMARPPQMTPQVTPQPAQLAMEEAPFVYSYHEEEIDDVAEAEAEPLSPEALAALDLEKRTNDIFQAYLEARATETDTEPP